MSIHKAIPDQLIPPAEIPIEDTLYVNITNAPKNNLTELAPTYGRVGMHSPELRDAIKPYIEQLHGEREAHIITQIDPSLYIKAHKELANIYKEKAAIVGDLTNRRLFTTLSETFEYFQSEEAVEHLQKLDARHEEEHLAQEQRFGSISLNRTIDNLIRHIEANAQNETLVEQLHNIWRNLIYFQELQAFTASLALEDDIPKEAKIAYIKNKAWSMYSTRGDRTDGYGQAWATILWGEDARIKQMNMTPIEYNRFITELYSTIDENYDQIVARSTSPVFQKLIDQAH